MGSQLSGFVHAFYNPERREFLGRDGGGWGKLGIFYFFFYLGLTGFFCAMLALLMILTPQDRPRYYLESSRMRTRSNPLAPGLGFRPQIVVEKNLIFVDKTVTNYEVDPYVKNLNQFLGVYYWNHAKEYSNETKEFVIRNPGDCTPENHYGFASGKPCVLVKLNKIVDFVPIPGYQLEDKSAYEAAGCRSDLSATAVHCYGDYPIDVDSIGDITYISENNRNDKCGSLETKWFPYKGKNQRRNVYQAPYVWVQFNNPKPNVLIHVICRVFAENINFDRKASRALTRFQIYVKDLFLQQSSSQNGEM